MMPLLVLFHHTWSILLLPHFAQTHLIERNKYRQYLHTIQRKKKDFDLTGPTCSDTTCNILDDFKHCRLTPQTNMSLFNVLCPQSHAFRETSQKVPHPKTNPSQACLNVEFVWFELPKRRCILLIWVVPNNYYKPSFNHAVTYLHGFRIPLISMWFGFA